MQILKYTLTCCFTLCLTILMAQPPNNDCATAIPLPTVSDTCTAVAAFDNINATASGFNPSCFTSTHDVWFSFVAIGTDVTITVIGNNFGSSGGTLTLPRVALITNPCGGTQSILRCELSSNNIVQLYRGSLVVGQTYYIQIDGSNEGTFQLCVNNYNAIPDPKSDCVDGVVLCDKSPFTVQSVVGAGNDPDEAGSSSCLGGLGGNSESNSTWYIWTCDQPGTLTFTLTPTNPNDDLDFVVYRLSNGVGNCAGKIEERCMASGATAATSPCMGPTGLNLTSVDVSEAPGCSPGDDNFISALNMTAGTTYGLMINNFTATGNGFNMQFGGTGTFQGPTANFTTSEPDNTICMGENITFTDNSSYPFGNLANYDWVFGVGATPQSATGAGPHSVTYNSPGLKKAVLIVETDEGCLKTITKDIMVDPCCQTVNILDITTTQQDLDCARIDDGTINLTINSAFAPYTYQWNPASLTGQSVSGLAAGNYTVTFTDGIGCDTIIDFTITSPPFFDVNYAIQQPTCAGGQDGGVTLAVTGASPPYQYDWGAGFQNNNSLNNIGNGFYTVGIRDSEGCDTSLTIEVWELVLELDTLIDFVFPPSCNGFSDGSITVSLSNGLAPYQYDWGSGFQASNTLTNLAAGTYSLTVQDANLCQGSFQIEVTEPDELQFNPVLTNVSCYGGNDGTATANVTGGTNTYTYQWSNGQTLMTAIDLIAGNYTVTVTDFNGCVITNTFTITEPDEIIIEDINVTDVFCYGGNDGQLDISVTGGTPPFEYSIDGDSFQTSNIFPNLVYGNYTVTVRDVLGCEYTRDAFVNQPWEFWIRAGDDVEIDLGYSTEIDALVNTNPPVNYLWTPVDGLSCTDCEDPTAAPVQTTTYVVEATDSRGCVAYDSLTVRVNIERPYFVPNAFTPNYDGLNDYFYVQGGPAIAQIRTMNIYDRWGNHVFDAQNAAPNDETLGWDGTHRGKKVNAGVFVYFIEIEFVDGYVEVLKGDVTVIE